MKRTAMTRRTPLTGRTVLRRVSRKRAREQREYTRQRAIFLTERPRCGFPGGCVRAATEVHHKRGRVGARYLDTSMWVGLCREHHAWVTEHPTAAVELGVSETRIGGAA